MQVSGTGVAWRVVLIKQLALEMKGTPDSVQVGKSGGEPEFMAGSRYQAEEVSLAHGLRVTGKPSSFSQISP